MELGFIQLNLYFFMHKDYSQESLTTVNFSTTEKFKIGYSLFLKCAFSLIISLGSKCNNMILMIMLQEGFADFFMTTTIVYRYTYHNVCRLSTATMVWQVLV